VCGWVWVWVCVSVVFVRKSKSACGCVQTLTSAISRMTVWCGCASTRRRVSRRGRKVLEAIIRTFSRRSSLQFPGIGSMVAGKIDDDNDDKSNNNNNNKKKFFYFVAAFLLHLPLLAFIYCLSAIYIFR